ncbi:MAG: type IV pilin protein [Alistipes indistinctus]
MPELLVVLVIIGILVLIALPNLMPLISRAKSTEAQQQLVFLHTLEKNNFYTYSKYSPSLEELGFEQQPLVTEGGHANYRIEIVEASERDSGRRPRPWWISTATASTTSGRSIRTRT